MIALVETSILCRHCGMPITKSSLSTTGWSHLRVSETPDRRYPYMLFDSIPRPYRHTAEPAEEA